MSKAPGDVRSIVIASPAERVFALLADPARLDRWSFGTWHSVLHDDGLVEGRSIFDGAVIFVRVDACPPRLLIDYHIGAERESLSPRIFARVTPGAVADLAPDHCVLTLAALRGAAMDDARWRRLVAAHGLELELLKSLLETGYDHRRPPPQQ